MSDLSDSKMKRNFAEISSDTEGTDDSSYTRAEEGRNLMLFNDENSPDSSSKRQKFNEKCRFWPACRSGNECNFHHPTITCKFFPSCKYGQRCLYIHPYCKFDAFCSREDCAYTHTSKRKLAGNVLPRSRRLGKVNIPCKFFPNCLSSICLYSHPKPCRNGIGCTVDGCSFSHSVPPEERQR